MKTETTKETEKQNRKITKKEKIHNAMHVMRCPYCRSIEASASERILLPDFTTCRNANCDY